MSKFLEIAVNYPKTPSILSYLSLEKEHFSRGDLVHLPLGRREEVGCVLSVKDTYEGNFDKEKLRPIKGHLPHGVALGPLELSLYEWMASYYHYPLGKLIFDSLPSFLEGKGTGPVLFPQGRGKDHPYALTEKQKEALDLLQERLKEGGFSKFYLHGVTGSGKTLVYLELAKKVLARGENVLFLIPEINLTPQFLEFFQDHLSCPILPYHSAVGVKHRDALWRKLKEEKGPFLVVGVRSCVFLPMDSLGLVIVDEEHDHSFKQTDRCPYNGRDVAIKKAQLSSCLVVLGSATPSSEHFHTYSQGGDYLFLGERVSGAQLPEVVLVDEREGEMGEHWPLHPNSLKALKKALDLGEQVLVFINRLGFANFIQCRSCGHSFKDPETDTVLRYFKKKKKLSSMHSNFSISLPEACPRCGNLNLLQKGFGSEKVQEVLSSFFPDHQVGRFDRDEVTTFKAIKKTLGEFERGDIHILVGTQMLSKGHNFKNVNTLLILGTDSMMNWPDFRSQEKAFQMLIQIAGRAGRYSQKGKVYLQTLSPETKLYRMVAKQDVHAFYERELFYRRELCFPPFSFLAAIYIGHRNQKTVMKAGMELRDKLQSSSRGLVEIQGPTPLVIEKRAGQCTWCLLLKSTNRRELHELLNLTQKSFSPLPGVLLKLMWTLIRFCKG